SLLPRTEESFFQNLLGKLPICDEPVCEGEHHARIAVIQHFERLRVTPRRAANQLGIAQLDEAGLHHYTSSPAGDALCALRRSCCGIRQNHCIWISPTPLWCSGFPRSCVVPVVLATFDRGHLRPEPSVYPMRSRLMEVGPAHC